MHMLLELAGGEPVAVLPNAWIGRLCAKRRVNVRALMRMCMCICMCLRMCFRTFKYMRM